MKYSLKRNPHQHGGTRDTIAVNVGKNRLEVKLKESSEHTPKGLFVIIRF